jgi:hypothetical protein
MPSDHASLTREPPFAYALGSRINDDIEDMRRHTMVHALGSRLPHERAAFSPSSRLAPVGAPAAQALGSRLAHERAAFSSCPCPRITHRSRESHAHASPHRCPCFKHNIIPRQPRWMILALILFTSQHQQRRALTTLLAFPPRRQQAFFAPGPVLSSIQQHCL